jgi:hypothetical protein
VHPLNLNLLPKLKKENIFTSSDLLVNLAKILIIWLLFMGFAHPYYSAKATLSRTSTIIIAVISSFPISKYIT